MMNDAIKVTDILDHEDGSATITLDMDPATYHKIFEQGNFLKLIQRGIESENVDEKKWDEINTDKLEMCLCSICEKAVFEEDVNEEGQCEDCVDQTNPYMEKKNVTRPAS
jgi:hypothetical protein